MEDVKRQKRKRRGDHFSTRHKGLPFDLKEAQRRWVAEEFK